MAQLYLLLGGNLGDKKKIFEKTYESLEHEIGKINAFSSIYETEPWGFESNDMFWNQALLIETNLKPEEVLVKTKSIEKELGRKKENSGYASRIIDIDILFYNDLQHQTTNLTIPHPQVENRKFVLVPMSDIAGKMKHPILKKSINELLQDCTDQLTVNKIS